MYEIYHPKIFAKYLVRTELASYSIFVGNKYNRNKYVGSAASYLVSKFVSNVHTVIYLRKTSFTRWKASWKLEI